MAIRNDITIDWSVSPRVILVDAPSVEITIQDLHDTLRWMESSASAMDNAPLVDSSGKEVLDAVTRVGLTMSLLDAKLGFEARADWTQCSISGGNLVAYDSAGVQFKSPIHPTAFVNIDRASSSSGTLQEQDALQYASYDGGVSVNTSSLNSGTEYPNGAVEYPVNNLADARIIAETKGFDKYWLHGNLFITAGDNVSDFTITNRSANPVKSIVAIDAAADTSGVHIDRCTVSGTLDNGIIIEDSVAIGINYVNGYLSNCVLASYEIVLGGNEPAFIMNCNSGVPNALRTEPSIDLGGEGQSLIMSGFDGEVTLRNKTGTDVCSIRGIGHLIIDATCTAGEIEVYGDMYITNNGTSVVVDRTTSTKEEIADEVELRQLPIDTVAIADAVWNKTIS